MIQVDRSKRSKELYHGIGLFSFVAVNPTKEVLLSTFGIEKEEEPNYTSTEEKATRIEIWLHNKENDIYVKGSYYLKDQLRESKNYPGKFQWIDKYGNTSWHAKGDIPSNSFYDFESGRIALNGEEDLVKFLRAYASIKRKDECRLDSIHEICRGDLSELESIFETFPNNTVYCGVGIKDNKFYELYKPTLLAGWVADYSKIAEKIKADTYVSKIDFGTFPYPFKKYEKAAITTTAPSEMLDEEELVGSTTGLKDDLPF